MKKLPLLLPIILFFLNTSCTKEITHTIYLHDTLSVVKPINFVTSDTVVKQDVTSDTVVQTRHDTLIITKYFTDSIKVIDTVYVTKSIFGDYKGDSVTISTIEDSGLTIATVQVSDMTSINSSGGYDRQYTGSPDLKTGLITVPNYQISIVRVDVKYNGTTGCHVDLIGFQYEHILTDNMIHFVNEGFLSSFQYVVIQNIFTIRARTS
jgi:hypothetical protein